MTWKEKYINDIILKPCPFCGNKAMFEDLTDNQTKHKGVKYGRVVCSKNNKFDFENRCCIKTVSAPLDMVVKSWNNRVWIKCTEKM